MLFVDEKGHPEGEGTPEVLKAGCQGAILLNVQAEIVECFLPSRDSVAC